MGRRRRAAGLAIALAALATAAPHRAADVTPTDALGVTVLHAAATADAPANRYPDETLPSGAWRTTSADGWTSGFFPGQLWLAYQATGDEALRRQALRWQAGLAGQRSRSDTHDVGFIVLDSFGNAERLTGDPRFARYLLDAAAALGRRYVPTVGMTRSWGRRADPHVQVISDNLMNLELLFWAADHGGDPKLRTMAVSHARRSIADLIRPDGSVRHRVRYDAATGRVIGRDNPQAESATSTWSRGQAWAIYGFTVAWRFTRDERFRQAARRVADYYLDHQPADLVPPWDFGATGPHEPKDSSAAAVAASALLELGAGAAPGAADARYARAGASILGVLSSPAYLDARPGARATLRHGTANRPAGHFDTGLVYGDYYFAEALLRLRWLRPTGPASAVTGLAASGGTPSRAVDGNPRTAWVAPTPVAWLRLDLGRPTAVSSVTARWIDGARRATRFRIETSTDGSRWRPAASGLTMGSSARAETYAVPGHPSARYVRLVDLGALAGGRTGVDEIAVNGDVPRPA
ncbi:MAG: Glucuronyl hydrolase [Acidimicrobiales bacterium]|nr:Glucuronyl hydrolase [Acidimicrobiales bacterium]